MHTRRFMPLVMALLAPTFLAAAAAPPSTKLAAGQWAYHSVTTFTSGMMAGRSITHDWKACVVNGEAMQQAIKPHGHGADVTCSKPTLSHDSTRYHTTMTCTTRARGMTSTLQEDFTLAVTDAGNAFSGHGTIDQDIALPGGAQSIHMKTEVSGHRTGACAAR